MIRAKYAVAAVTAGLLLLMFLAYAALSFSSPICFDDCSTYVELMQMKGQAYRETLTAMAWPWAMPEVQPWKAAMLRPWAVPLFFSLFGEFSPESSLGIVAAQTAIQFCSWLLLGCVAGSFVRGQAVRAAVVVAVAAMMFGQGYQHFNRYLLSDSLALSSVLVQLSLCLCFSRVVAWAGGKRHGRYLIAAYILLVGAVSAAEMGTRDANISLALAGVCLTFLQTGRTTLAPKLTTLALVAALAVPAVAGAQRRHQVNDENILIGVVLPDAQARQFFIEHGMDRQLAASANGLRVQDLAHIDNLEMDRLKAERHDALRPILPAFDRLYAQYLALHPSFVVKALGRYWKLIVGQFLDPGLAPRLSLTDWIPIWLFPVFPLAYLTLPDLRRRVGLWPPALACIGAGNAVLGFFGDVWTPGEMARHALIGSAVMRVGVILCTAFVGTSLWSDRSEHRRWFLAALSQGARMPRQTSPSA